VTQREFVGRTVTILALGALAWLLAWFVRQVADVFILLLIAAILAAGFAPIVGVVERWCVPGGIRISRPVAIFVLYLGIFAVIILILSVIVVPAAREAGAFVRALPQFLIHFRRWLADLRVHMTWLPDLAGVLDKLPTEISGLARYGPQAAGIAFRFLGGIGFAVAVLVFTFYMLLEGASIKRGFLNVIPPSERSRVSRVLQQIGMKFGGWLRGQLLLSFSVATPVAVVFLLLGIPYPFLLGLIAGLGELVPMVGPSFAATVGFLVALSQPLWKVVSVAIFYILLLNIEPQILVPRIMGRAIGVPPILTLFALLAGIKLMGIIGGLIAVPVAAAIQVIVGEVVAALQPGTPAAPLPPPDDPAAPASRTKTA